MTHDYRALAVDLLSWACAGDKVGEFHPRYVQVTEGRDPGPGYSSCADLVHWLWFRLGLRIPQINRAEHNGWRPQVNVYRLVEAARAYGGLEDYPIGTLQERWRKRCNGDNRANPGDLIIVANNWPAGSDAHVVSIVERLAKGYRTAEYGLPGGGIQVREEFGRTQRVWLPLDSLIATARKRGELVEPDLPAEFGDDHHDTDPCPAPVPEPLPVRTLRKGMKGRDVGHWQEALIAWNPRALPVYGIDDDFGDETEEWTIRFQKAHGLGVGEVDERTRKAAGL